MRLLKFFSILYTVHQQVQHEDRLLKQQEGEIRYLEDMLLSSTGADIRFSEGDITCEVNRIVHRRELERNFSERILKQL